MKKVLSIGGFAVLGIVALSSCKKDYTCTFSAGSVSTSQTYTDLTKTQADAQETNCEFLGGTWAKK